LTLDQLHDALQTILVGYVGTYVRPDGTTVPAVWKGARLPAGYKVSATEPRVEVVVQRTPELSTTTVHNGQVVEREWIVRAKAWGTTGVGAVVERILACTPGATAGPLIPETDVTLEEQVVRIPDEPVGYARQ
jgi:hypothetical protein